jgi:hypothetical protein
MKHITIEQLKSEQLDELTEIQNRNNFVSHTTHQVNRDDHKHAYFNKSRQDGNGRWEHTNAHMSHVSQQQPFVQSDAGFDDSLTRFNSGSKRKSALKSHLSSQTKNYMGSQYERANIQYRPSNIDVTSIDG